MTTKVEISRKTCLRGTTLRQTVSFEISYVEIGSPVWAVRVAKNNKVIEHVAYNVNFTADLIRNQNWQG